MSASGSSQLSHEKRRGRLQHVLRVGVTQVQTVVSGKQIGAARVLGPTQRLDLVVTCPVECRYPARYRNSARMEYRFVRPNRHSTGTPTP